MRGAAGALEGGEEQDGEERVREVVDLEADLVLRLGGELEFHGVDTGIEDEDVESRSFALDAGGEVGHGGGRGEVETEDGDGRRGIALCHNWVREQLALCILAFGRCANGEDEVREVEMEEMPGYL